MFPFKPINTFLASLNPKSLWFLDAVREDVKLNPKDKISNGQNGLASPILKTCFSGLAREGNVLDHRGLPSTTAKGFIILKEFNY